MPLIFFSFFNLSGIGALFGGGQAQVAMGLLVTLVTLLEDV